MNVPVKSNSWGKQNLDCQVIYITKRLHNQVVPGKEHLKLISITENKPSVMAI